MNASTLLTDSKERMSKLELNGSSFSICGFKEGARWMHSALKSLDANFQNAFQKKVRYNLYGILKYSLSVLGLVFSAHALSKIHVGLIPLSVVVFYMIEIHFLFLFPILIEGNPKPIRTSIQLTYQIGFLHVLFVVAPIGIYMLMGLLNFKNPLKNWYVGCYSVLLWYVHETRDRP